MRRKSWVIFFCLFILTSACTAQWTVLAPMVNARGQHAAIAHSNGNIYVWGGFLGAGNPMSSLEIYNVSTDTWSSGAPIPTATRGQAFALGQDNMIYSIGGFSASYLTNAYKYDVTANTWAAIPSIPTGCWECTGATGVNGNIYVFGGETPFQNVSGIVQIYNPVSNLWGSGSPIPVPVKMHSAVAAPNGKIYVIGGFDGFNALTNNQIYDPVLDSWSTGAPLPTARDQFGATLGPDGKIYIIGGKTNGTNNQPPFFNLLDIYDPTTDTWSVGSAVPATIGETEAVAANGGIHLLAGTNGTYLNTNYRLEVAACTSLAVTTSPPITICVGQNTTLTANVTGGNPGYNYMWSTGSGTASINVSPASNTTYYVTVTDTIGCMIISQPVTVSVSPPITLDAAGSIAICNGASVQISAQANGGDGNFTYTWTPNIGSGAGPHTVSPNTTTIYLVSVTDGCGTSPAPDSAVVIVHPLPAVSFTGSNLAGCTPLASCFTDMSTVSSGTVTQWAWNFGDTTAVVHGQNPCHTYHSAGQHSVTLIATSNFGCSQSFTIPDYTEAFPVNHAAFTYTVIGLNVYFFDNSSSAVSWNWNFGDSTTDTAQNPHHIFSAGGQYIACFTAPNSYGCSDTTCAIINAIDVGIEENNSEESVNLFPNPTTGKFEIRSRVLGTKSEIKEVTIYDAHGKKVLSQKPVTKSQKQIVNVSELNAGIYLVRIQGADNEYRTLKLTKF